MKRAGRMIGKMLLGIVLLPPFLRFCIAIVCTWISFHTGKQMSHEIFQSLTWGIITGSVLGWCFWCYRQSQRTGQSGPMNLIAEMSAGLLLIPLTAYFLYTSVYQLIYRHLYGYVIIEIRPLTSFDIWSRRIEILVLALVPVMMAWWCIHCYRKAKA